MFPKIRNLFTPSVPEITVEELKSRRDRGEKVFILDVREPDERKICRIEGSLLIPLGELPSRLGELDKKEEIIVHCKAGVRSARAVQYLRQQGFTALNLAGGIDAWSERIDPSVPKY